MNHKVAMDLETLEARLDGPALEAWAALPLTKQILMVREVEEIMLCSFRRTRLDPNYAEGEEAAWRKVIEATVGSEGLDRVGI